MTAPQTLAVGGVSFRLIDRGGHPELDKSPPGFEALTVVVNSAARGELGDPCTLSDQIRNGELIYNPLCDITPAAEDDADRVGAWIDPNGGPLCRISVAFAAVFRRGLLASRHWVAELLDQLLRVRLSGSRRWIFQAHPLWCKPAPGEEEAVIALERRATEVRSNEPSRKPSQQYTAWLASSDALLLELEAFGLLEHPGPLKHECLSNWHCSELLAWYEAGCARAAWLQDGRFERAPLDREYAMQPSSLSLWLFRFQRRPEAALLIASEERVRQLAPPAQDGLGHFELQGIRVFWRLELGRPMVVSIDAG